MVYFKISALTEIFNEKKKNKKEIKGKQNNR